MQKRHTLSPFGCPPTTGRCVSRSSRSVVILRLLAGGVPSEPSAIASNFLPDLLGVALLFLCCLESPISTYLYALQNARIVEADARLHYTAIFIYFKLSMFFCTFFVTIVWCFCVLSTKEASSRRASSSRFEMRAQSTFRCWYHRPFYTPLTTDGSHASWKLRIRSVCVYIYDMYV